jgi:hypothetical protein
MLNSVKLKKGSLSRKEEGGEGSQNFTIVVSPVYTEQVNIQEGCEYLVRFEIG